LHSATPFGINVGDDALEFFPGLEEQAGLKIVYSGGGTVEVGVQDWPKDFTQARRWTEACSSAAGSVREFLPGLKPRQDYEVRVNGALWRKIQSDDSGTIQFKRKLRGTVETLELVPAP
jgi:hypothetical protein